jgi:hypothetical protein
VQGCCNTGTQHMMCWVAALCLGGGVLCASMWPGDCWYFVDFASGSSKRKRDKLGGARSVQTLMVS